MVSTVPEVYVWMIVTLNKVKGHAVTSNTNSYGTQNQLLPWLPISLLPTTIMTCMIVLIVMFNRMCSGPFLPLAIMPYIFTAPSMKVLSEG
ncbi:hypothetical protein C1645_835996 [Glomus cerebriforme]|uniref:Uncharacterized protein n=1 Tax=Glomus cerebriforme TaxID=658196 RepID=A0A397SHS0_9GLOM|nr:hypothetical protein C1645_835996 [Glomus cerebriforme]